MDEIIKVRHKQEHLMFGKEICIGEYSVFANDVGKNQ